ncbi:hypothetical protein T265_12345 [Opisthorchis viverrini]|uniref:Uncharacterized protein n=1 Tax=Opisthorchis viverrini TaxID=6198 RepID=A0A074Z4J1_OPIVI|nr:hypothetical protein T265_12345 [Opisthorchis viverrini]KER18195.1 hypothetical protein T265_12345 [Opisthorchis viverrini]
MEYGTVRKGVIGRASRIATASAVDRIHIPVNRETKWEAEFVKRRILWTAEAVEFAQPNVPLFAHKRSAVYVCYSFMHVKTGQLLLPLLYLEEELSGGGLMTWFGPIWACSQ